jgi:hypothetical protein
MAAMLFLVFFFTFLALLHLATKQCTRRPKNKHVRINTC